MWPYIVHTCKNAIEIFVSFVRHWNRFDEFFPEFLLCVLWSWLGFWIQDCYDKRIGAGIA